MKKLMAFLSSSMLVLFGAIAVGAAQLFAAAPCGGPYYEPELPEELVK